MPSQLLPLFWDYLFRFCVWVFLEIRSHATQLAQNLLCSWEWLCCCWFGVIFNYISLFWWVGHIHATLWKSKDNLRELVLYDVGTRKLHSRHQACFTHWATSLAAKNDYWIPDPLASISQELVLKTCTTMLTFLRLFSYLPTPHKLSAPYVSTYRVHHHELNSTGEVPGEIPWLYKSISL